MARDGDARAHFAGTTDGVKPFDANFAKLRALRVFHLIFGGNTHDNR